MIELRVKSLEVGVQMATLRKLFVTMMTFEWFLPRMRPHVGV